MVESSIPKTPTPFCDKAKILSYQELVLTVMCRPVVAFFSEKKKAIHRLIKVSPIVGDDVWILTSRQDAVPFPSFGVEVHGCGPTTLKKILKELTPENGWVLCEFNTELEYLKAAIKYLEDNGCPYG